METEISEAIAVQMNKHNNNKISVLRAKSFDLSNYFLFFGNLNHKIQKI